LIDKNYLLDKITEEQILNILQKHGATPHGLIKPNEIWFKTICHNGNSHKLCYYRETKTFYCYTNCGQMSLFSFIMHLKNFTFLESIEYLAKEIGVSNRKGFNQFTYHINNDIAKIDSYIDLRKRNKKSIENLPSIETHILKYFENNVFYQGWIDEGISIPTMEEFKILWYEIEKHVIIPHYNSVGELVGIRRRSLQEKDKNNKYMPEIIEGHLFTHSLGLNLYGLDKHLSGIVKTKKVVIVESEKSVLLAHEFYKDDAFVIATCGFNISNWQRDTLLNLGIEEVMLGFDKDFNENDFADTNENDIEYQKYQRYIKRIYSIAHKFSAYCRTYVIWDCMDLLGYKDSPFDKGKEVLETLMKNKIEITTE